MRHAPRPAVEREEGPRPRVERRDDGVTLRMNRWVRRPEVARGSPGATRRPHRAARVAIRLHATVPRGCPAGSRPRPATRGRRRRGQKGPLKLRSDWSHSGSRPRQSVAGMQRNRGAGRRAMPLFLRSIRSAHQAHRTDFERESARESRVRSPPPRALAGLDRSRKRHGRDHTTYANITGLFLVGAAWTRRPRPTIADCSVGFGVGPIRRGGV
jgi:hypothetical protein